VFVPCEVCGGSRFKREVLDVKLQGASIARALEWTVDQAMQRLHRHPAWRARSGISSRWGSDTCGLASRHDAVGGEAQRLKIARELARTKGRAAALHSRRADHRPAPRRRARAVSRARPAGGCRAHRVVIEHNLDVIKRADWVIDLGPGAGDQGGRVVAAGTPEDVAQVAGSVTGKVFAGFGVTKRRADLLLITAAAVWV